MGVHTPKLVFQPSILYHIYCTFTFCGSKPAYINMFVKWNFFTVPKIYLDNDTLSRQMILNLDI